VLHHSDTVFSLSVTSASTLSLTEQGEPEEVLEKEQEFVSVQEPCIGIGVYLADVSELFFDGTA
jgi:hypothetical protein